MAVIALKHVQKSFGAVNIIGDQEPSAPPDPPAATSPANSPSN